MKAQQRHQLQTNALADRVGKMLTGMKSSQTSSSPLVWVFVILAVGTIGVWQFFSRTGQSERAELWMHLDEAQQNPQLGLSNMAALSKEAEGTMPGRAAGFDLARAQLEGSLAMLNSIQRSEAINQLKQVRDRYEKLSKQCPDSPLLAQEALMGVATATESLAGVDKPENAAEDLEQAISDYRKLANAYPDGHLGKEAARRAGKLEEHRQQVTKFYEELGQLTEHKKQDIKPPEVPKQEPKPLESTGPEVPPPPAEPKLEPRLPEDKAKDAKPTGNKTPDLKTPDKTKDSKPADVKASEPKTQEKPKESKAPAPKNP